MKSKAGIFTITLVFVLAWLAACTKTPTTPPATATETLSAQTELSATTAVVETAAPTNEATPAPIVDANALPPDPRIITVTTKDNFTLSGYYYPAAVENAPLVILMHWAGGDQHDWNEIAVWLQNRGMKNPFENPGDQGWWDPSWFPVMPADRSYAVLTFTFRECLPYNKGGCPKIDEAGFLADIEGVIHKVHKFEGVDLNRVAIIGSSIGADGAVYGCAFYNDQFDESCQGALSLSPGSFLGVPYPEVITKLGATDPPTPAWCLADEKEYPVCESAAEANNPAYKSFMVKAGGHGNYLLTRLLTPLPMQLIIDFLDETIP